MTKLDAFVETLIDRFGMIPTKKNGVRGQQSYEAKGVCLEYSPSVRAGALWWCSENYWDGVLLAERDDKVTASYREDCSEKAVVRWSRVDRAFGGALQAALRERALHLHEHGVRAKEETFEWRLAERIGDYIVAHPSDENPMGG